MLKKYRIANGELTESADDSSAVWFYAAPNEDERKNLTENLRIDSHTLGSALDPEEASRLEFEPDHLALIYKYPKNFSKEDQFRFAVGSLGLFLYRDRLVIVASEEISLMGRKHLVAMKSINDVLLRLIYSSLDRYLEHLRAINSISEEIETKINVSMENKYLLNLFTLEKSLIYYLNAIDSNGFVFEKLKHSSSKIGFSNSELEYLDDLIIENTQCHRQAEIHSLVLAEMMDARVSIVNNNISILVKKLNLVTIGIMVPTFVVSAFSMNVAIPWQHRPFAFWIVLTLAAVSVIGVLLWWKREKTPALHK